MRRELQQRLRLELTQRFAYGHPADIERGGQRFLAQRRPRRNPAVQDRLAQHPLNEFGGGARPVGLPGRQSGEVEPVVGIHQDLSTC